MKLIDAYREEEGYKKISKYFHLSEMSFKKWQFRETVEVTARPRRPRKLLDTAVII